MFTGIIETVGEVAAIEKLGGDLRLYVRASGWQWRDVGLGDSIATNGVCLTAVELPGDGFWADVSNETLRHTNIGNWRRGTPVNLEKALLPTTRLGGHFVSGHIDGVGEVIRRHSDARSERFDFRVPAGLGRYIAPKGSITIDGTSLTVNRVGTADGADWFSVNIVPHTLAATVMGGYTKGTEVNLEVDILARYLERLLKGEASAESGISADFLARHGFLPGSSGP